MLLTVTFFFLVILLFFNLKYKFDQFKRWGVKSMSPIQQLFCLSMTLMGRQSIGDHFAFVGHYFPRERYVGMFDGTNPIILARSPEAIKKICIENFNCFTEHQMRVDLDTDALFGRQIFFMKGQEWRDMRTDIGLAYSSLKLKALFNYLTNYVTKSMQDYLEVYNNNIDAAKDKSKDGMFYEVKANNFFIQHTHGYLAKTIFNDDSKHIVKELHEFCNITDLITRWGLFKLIVLKNLPKFVKTRIPIFRPSFWSYTENALLTCFKWRKNLNLNVPDFLQTLMESKKGWPLDVLTAQVILLINSYSTIIPQHITTILHELACNPEILKRLQDEVDTAYSRTDGKLTLDDLNDMEYLDMVHSESLRKWPPASITDRVCTKDCDLGPINDNSDFTLKVKKGDNVIIHVYSLHNDPEIWNEPKKFDPERFSKENRPNIKPYAFIPFGVGPRNCIAFRQAVIHVKLMIYYFVLNFDIKRGTKMKDGMRLAPFTILTHFEGGSWIKIRPRK